MLPRLVAAAAALALVPVLASCGSGSDSATARDTTSAKACDYRKDSTPAARKVSEPPTTPTVHGTIPLTMQTTIGTLTGTLDASHAPCTVGSFVSLAKQGYFDKTPCHRLTLAATGIYVLQCGDPTGTGSGGPGYTIPDELTGTETYPAGTLAMANESAPNTGGSQFFIVYKNTPLPAQYTVFGRVDAAAVKTIAKIAKKGVDNAYGAGDGHPNVKVDLQHVTTG